MFGAVVDSVLVAESEDHAGLVRSEVGVRRGDEVFDGGTHVVGQFREEGLRLGFSEGTHGEVDGESNMRGI